MKIEYTLSSKEYKKELSKFNKLNSLNYFIDKFTSKNTTSNIELSLLTDSVEIYENNSYMNIPLASIIRVQENENFIYILNNFDYKIIIPKIAFMNKYDEQSFIDIITSHLNQNKRFLNIDKKTLIYNNKIVYNLFCMIIPIIFSISAFFTEFKYSNLLETLSMIFMTSALISLLYHFIFVISFKYKLKIKNIEKNFSYKYDNNTLEVSSLNFLIRLENTDLKKINIIKKNIYFSTSNIIINNCFLPRDDSRTAKNLLLDFKSIKIKKYRLFYKNSSYTLLFFLAISIIIFPKVLKAIVILISLIYFYITVLIYQILN